MEERGRALEGDQRHAEIAIELMGLIGAKEARTPGGEEKEEEEDEEELEREDAREF